MLTPEPLPPWPRRACALIALLLHTAYASIYGYEARQYYLQTFVNSTLQNAYARALGVVYSASRPRSLTMCITSSLIAAWHSARILSAVASSIRHRELLMSDPLTDQIPSEGIVAKLRRLSSSKLGNYGNQTAVKAAIKPKSKCSRCVHFFRSSLQRARQLVGRIGGIWRSYFTIDGEHYETGTEIRELLEILTQVNVVRRMTQTIVDSGFTENVTIALILNCWSTPLLRAVFRKRSVTTNRVGRLVVGMVIATCFTVLVPFLAWAKVNQLTSSSADYLDPTQPAELRAAAHFAFKDGWLDIVSSRVAAGVAIMALNAARRKVTLGSSPKHREPVAVATLAPPASGSSRASSSSSNDDDLDARKQTVVRPSAQNNRPIRSKVFDGIGIFAGVFVLAVHVEAKLRHTNVPPALGLKCERLVYPWSTLRWPCSVLEVNCHRAGVSGRREELAALLGLIDTASLTYVRFTHCPALEMPSEIQSFRNLAHLEVFNATLVEWSEEAALLSRNQPNLGRLWLYGVRNMTMLPPGITTPGFPVVDVSVCLSDLSELPSDLGSRWPTVMTNIGFESTGLSAFPASLAQMSAFSYEFKGNNFTSIPLEILRGHTIAALRLSSNTALSDLPQEDWYASYVDIRSTNIARLPQWAYEKQAGGNFHVIGSSTAGFTAVIAAGNTPFCEAQLRVDPALVTTRLPSALVDCSEPPTPSPIANCSIPFEYLAITRPV
ncbi:hypothetical protein PINS_up019691 [Pythium insidiosum]|nr:hypothetical protein PINS_up019691 [Pythium insidiosum]